MHDPDIIHPLTSLHYTPNTIVLPPPHAGNLRMWF